MNTPLGPSPTDRIEKKLLLKAPPARVWRALADSREFGSWFRFDIDGAFEPGRRLIARVAEPGYEHLRVEMLIERMEPERVFAWRWHPHAIDPVKDYSPEPMTLVEFTLTPVDGGTLLTLVESGFDAVPIERRMDAWRSNDGGWNEQMERIEQYLVDSA